MRKMKNNQFFTKPRYIQNAKKSIEKSIKMVDILLEVYDARIPYTSLQNNLFLTNKKRIILFNKTDIADSYWNQKWQKYYEKKFSFCFFLSIKKKKT